MNEFGCHEFQTSIAKRSRATEMQHRSAANKTVSRDGGDGRGFSPRALARDAREKSGSPVTLAASATRALARPRSVRVRSLAPAAPLARRRRRCRARARSPRSPRRRLFRARMTLLNSSAESRPGSSNSSAQPPLIAPPPGFHAGQTQWPAPADALAFPAMAAHAAQAAAVQAGAAPSPPGAEPSRRVPAAITSKFKGVSWDRVRPLPHGGAASYARDFALPKSACACGEPKPTRCTSATLRTSSRLPARTTPQS